MEISEVRVKLVLPARDKLRAFCSITVDDAFVIRDLKIIDGPDGPFLAMPSRKLSDRCPRCGIKNHLRASYCNDCGLRLPEQRAGQDARGRAKLHADVAHPINARCREKLQQRTLAAFDEEVGRSQAPGYVPQELHEMVGFDDDGPGARSLSEKVGGRKGSVATTRGSGGR